MIFIKLDIYIYKIYYFMIFIKVGKSLTFYHIENSYETQIKGYITQ